MRFVTIMPLALMSMVFVADAPGGDLIDLLQKKKSEATIEFLNSAPFGVEVAIKDGEDAIFESTLEPNDEDETDVQAGTYTLCVTPLDEPNGNEEETGATTSNVGTSHEPIEQEITVESGDCLHVEIVYGEGGLGVELSDCNAQEEVASTAVRESVVLAASMSGLLMLAVFGSLFGRAPRRRPEEEVPTE